MASLQTAVENLKKHGFDARAFETGEEAAAAALELIGSRSVGFGGSVTLRDLGIYPRRRRATPPGSPRAFRATMCRTCICARRGRRCFF